MIWVSLVFLLIAVGAFTLWAIRFLKWVWWKVYWAPETFENGVGRWTW